MEKPRVVMRLRAVRRRRSLAGASPARRRGVSAGRSRNVAGVMIAA
jgi:hypothetical protein